MDWNRAVIGIEFGSTRIKAVLMDENHLPVASGSYDWENQFVNGIWTYALDEIHHGLQACYADLKKNVKEQYGVTITKFAAIGFSAMMHGYLPFDENDTLLVPFRTWRNTITEEAAEYLRKLVIAGYNIFISGGTGSGKTTFLNVLSNYIPKEERIITIEDSAELKINGIENLVSLECRQANVEGENEVTIRDLIRTSLRMRPNRIIVGEVRGPETLDMLQAMNTGHDGSLSTGHANSPADMLTRLETMVLMGTDMPLSAIKSQIASALDLIIHLGRMKDGSRKVLEITEVLGYIDGSIRLSPLFIYQESSPRERQEGKRTGTLRWTGNHLKNRGKGIYSGIFEESYETGRSNLD